MHLRNGVYHGVNGVYHGWRSELQFRLELQRVPSSIGVVVEEVRGLVPPPRSSAPAAEAAATEAAAAAAYDGLYQLRAISMATGVLD
jgi:hypothetical protein